MKRKQKFAIHTINVTQDYTIYYLYRLVAPFNIGLNVFSDLQFLGIIRKSGGVQAYNPNISDYEPESGCKNLFRAARHLIRRYS